MFQVLGILNNLKFVITIKKERRCHQLIDENYHRKYFILSPGALLGVWGRDGEPDGDCGSMSMIPTGMESNYSVLVPWEAADKASLFPAFISTRYNNYANRIIAFASWMYKESAWTLLAYSSP